MLGYAYPPGLLLSLRSVTSQRQHKARHQDCNVFSSFKWLRLNIFKHGFVYLFFLKQFKKCSSFYDVTKDSNFSSNQVPSLLGRPNIASEFSQEEKASRYLHIYFAMGCKQKANHAVVWGSVEGVFWRLYRRERLLLQTSQVLAL